ncbi:MAG: hypothetical protein JSW14_06005 [Candidatus Bathyarchaeum sp.]|nr:MAG: hypothetical protein JSW14_06005 [Candidatus Bathyarchaeum sp.]
MKRSASKITLILELLALLVAGVQTVKAPYTSDGRAFVLASPISITSPSNITYNSNLLTLNVTFKLLLSLSCAHVIYSVDGKDNVTIPLTATRDLIEATVTYENGTTVTTNATFVPYIVTGGVVLPELSEGQHRITVHAKYNINNIIALDESTVYFTIGTNSEQDIPEKNLTIFGFLSLGIILLTIKLVYVRKEKNEKQ